MSCRAKRPWRVAMPDIPTCGTCQFFKPAHQDFGACICPFQPKHLEREANAACVYWTSRPKPEPPGRVLKLRDGATPGAPPPNTA